jgi:transcriptional regulator with XRE-family HTH domain
MSTETHPLIEYLKTKRIKQTAFAKEVGISRTHLYRIMRGEGTTTATLQKISAATDGNVPVSAFLEAVQ